MAVMRGSPLMLLDLLLSLIAIDSFKVGVKLLIFHCGKSGGIV